MHTGSSPGVAGSFGKQTQPFVPARNCFGWAPSAAGQSIIVASLAMDMGAALIAFLILPSGVLVSVDGLDSSVQPSTPNDKNANTNADATNLSEKLDMINYPFLSADCNTWRTRYKIFSIAEGGQKEESAHLLGRATRVFYDAVTKNAEALRDSNPARQVLTKALANSLSERVGLISPTVPEQTLHCQETQLAGQRER